MKLLYVFIYLPLLGDEVNIVEQDGDGWWKAELRGAVGLIPESYVEVIR